MTDLTARAAALDSADPLAGYREQFLAPDEFDVVSYRQPDGLRIGPAALSTSFGEVNRGVSTLRDLLEK